MKFQIYIKIKLLQTIKDLFQKYISFTFKINSNIFSKNIISHETYNNSDNMKYYSL